MDPNANLKEILDLLSDGQKRPLNEWDRDRLVELLEAQAGWISNGGFLPTVNKIDARTYLIEK